MEAIRRREALALSRLDLAWAGAVAAIAAILFATTLTGHPGLGDAPESVAGVESLGILHAPGYPAYVLAAWLFTLFIPFGSLAFQVNLFSLVCASLSVAGVYLLARRFGAARWAGALGALALACGGAFWFYATFAKHDMFSGLLFVAALNCLLSWQARPSTGRLVAVGVLLGLGFGSSWPLTVLILPAVALALALAWRQLSVGSVAVAAAACVVVTVGLYGFVMARAAQEPEVNWGDATSIGRLKALVNRESFKPPSNPGPSAAGEQDEGADSEQSAPAESSEPDSSLHTLKSIGAYLAVFYAELGLVALALAGWGLIVSVAWRRGPPVYLLLAVFGTNLVGAALEVGPGSFDGMETVLGQEGFLLGCYFALAAWLAIGATELATAVAESGSPGDRQRQRAAVGWGLPAVIGAAVIVPSLVMNWDVPRRSGAPFADRYALAALAEAPRRSALFILGAERTQPLIYRQVVLGDRPDVVVIATDGLSYEWYREELTRRLGRTLPQRVGTSGPDAVRAIKSLRGVRPVYMDMPTANVLGGKIGFRPVGLLARLTGGTGPARVPAARLEREVLGNQRAAGTSDPDWQEWPNSYVLGSFVTAAFEVVGAYIEDGDEQGVRRALLNVLRLDPENEPARQNLVILDAQGLNGG